MPVKTGMSKILANEMDSSSSNSSSEEEEVQLISESTEKKSIQKNSIERKLSLRSNSSSDKSISKEAYDLVNSLLNMKNLDKRSNLKKSEDSSGDQSSTNNKTGQKKCDSEDDNDLKKEDDDVHSELLSKKDSLLIRKLSSLPEQPKKVIKTPIPLKNILSVMVIRGNIGNRNEINNQISKFGLDMFLGRLKGSQIDFSIISELIQIPVHGCDLKAGHLICNKEFHKICNNVGIEKDDFKHKRVTAIIAKQVRGKGKNTSNNYTEERILPEGYNFTKNMVSSLMIDDLNMTKLQQKYLLSTLINYVLFFAVNFSQSLNQEEGENRGLDVRLDDIVQDEERIDNDDKNNDERNDKRVKIFIVFGGDYYGQGDERIIVSKELKSNHKSQYVTKTMKNFPIDTSDFLNELNDKLISKDPLKYHINKPFTVENYKIIPTIKSGFLPPDMNKSKKNMNVIYYQSESGAEPLHNDGNGIELINDSDTVIRLFIAPVIVPVESLPAFRQGAGYGFINNVMKIRGIEEYKRILEGMFKLHTIKSDFGINGKSFYSLLPASTGSRAAVFQSLSEKLVIFPEDRSDNAIDLGILLRNKLIDLITLDFPTVATIISGAVAQYKSKIEDNSIQRLKHTTSRSHSSSSSESDTSSSSEDRKQKRKNKKRKREEKREKREEKKAKKRNKTEKKRKNNVDDGYSSNEENRSPNIPK